MGGEVAVVAPECLEAACQIEWGAGQARDFAHGMRVDGDGGVEAERDGLHRVFRPCAGRSAAMGAAGDFEYVDGRRRARQKRGEIRARDIRDIGEAKRPCEIVARAHGNHAEGGAPALLDAHETAGDLVHHAVAAERYDGVVFRRTGRDLGRVARALGLRDVEGLAVAVHGEESLEALGRSRCGTALRRGIHHDQHSPEGVHAVHVHSSISSSSSRRWRSRAPSTVRAASSLSPLRLGVTMRCAGYTAACPATR